MTTPILTRRFSSGDLKNHLNTTREELKNWHKHSPIFSGVEETPASKPSWIKSFLTKVWEIVKKCFKFLVGCALFVSNPSFFAVGFIIGLVMTSSKKENEEGCINKTITTIKNIWKKQKFTAAAVIGIGAFLALPVTLAATSFGYGAYLGATIANKAMQK